VWRKVPPTKTPRYTNLSPSPGWITTDLRWIPLQIYKPARPAPIITVTKLQPSQQAKGFGFGTSSQMTWENFVEWLGQYSTLEFGNRFATSEAPDKATIDAILLSDFSSLKFKGADNLDMDEFAVLRSSQAAEAASAAAASDSIVSQNPFTNISLAGLKLI